jgi:phenylacetate-CoA ligase
MDLHALLIRNAIGPAWAAWEGSPYLRQYRALLRTQFLPLHEIRERQWNAIQRILNHASRTVPYYRERWNAGETSPDRFRGLDDFHSLPILTKKDIREAGSSLLSEQYRGKTDLTCNKTSGSTGVSLAVWADEECMQFRRATQLRSDEWSGWRHGEPVAMVWGNPEYLCHGWRGRLRNALLDRARYLDTLMMDEAAMTRFAEDLTRQPASLIFGHAHSVYLFAEFVGRRALGPIRPRAIITSAMVLHDWQRTLIEEVFHSRVTNRYGCEEVGLIACECERHEGLHVNCDSLYLEIVRDGEPVPPGEPGSVVVTDLTNRAMPLIRYKIGDVASWTGRSCSCGRGLSLLERVEGREADYITTSRGELISGISLTENFALLVPGIAQIQIVQQELDRFLFRIVRGVGFDAASLDRITALVEERFGPGTAFDCEYVDKIPRESSGKYRFCISRVPNSWSSPKVMEAASS